MINSQITGTDLYKAMQNIESEWVEEAADIKPLKKKTVFPWSERVMDNLATAAIICLVVVALMLAPRIVKSFLNEQLSPAGIEATSDAETIEYNSKEEQQETVADVVISYENVPKDGKVIDGVLYEYSTWLERYVISKWTVPAKPDILSVKNIAPGFSTDYYLTRAVSNNAFITESNAHAMYYLVQLSVSTESPRYYRQEAIYSAIMEHGNYGLYIGEAGRYKSNYGDYYIEHDKFIYGILTYEQMKEIASKFASLDSSNSIMYCLLSAFETDKANIYTDGNIPKYSQEELEAQLKCVYSKYKDKYVMSKNLGLQGVVYTDILSLPSASEPIAYSGKLMEAIGHNPVININNAKKMAYLVEIQVYDVSVTSDNEEINKYISLLDNKIKDDKLKQEYERLKSICNYDIILGEKHWDSDSSTTAIYGILTYDEMKNIPKNEGYGYSFQIDSENSIGAKGIIEEKLYGKDYTTVYPVKEKN